MRPARLQAVGRANPLGYEVDAPRGLPLGTPARLGPDLAVLTGAAALGSWPPPPRSAGSPGDRPDTART
ncbi:MULTISPECIES: hypothetical protein [unclassified Streptomyces]|uniref:hypothetical protein n=1 Tax=unclassified Streptomyces TaxID=2593676 RepID=UPI0004C06252